MMRGARCVRHAQRLYFLEQLRAVGAVNSQEGAALPPPFATFLLVGACAVATGVCCWGGRGLPPNTGSTVAVLFQWGRTTITL